MDYASVVMWTHRFPHSGACSGANGWQDHKMRDQHYFYDAFRTCPYCGRVLDGHSVADYTVSVSLIQCLVMLVMSTRVAPYSDCWDDFSASRMVGCPRDRC